MKDILDPLSSGLTSEQVLEELTDLEAADIEAELKYASHQLDRPVIAV